RLVVPFVLYPVPAPSASLVKRVGTHGLDHQPLASISNSLFNVRIKLPRLLHNHLVREAQPLTYLDHASKGPPALRVSDPSIICPVSIQEVKEKNPDRYLLNHLLQLILSAPTLRDQLEGKEVTRGWIYRDRFTLNNRLP